MKTLQELKNNVRQNDLKCLEFALKDIERIKRYNNDSSDKFMAILEAENAIAKLINLI